MNEFFDVLNANGEYTNEVASRDECHRKGLYHKAVVVFIVSEDNERVLLQQRSSTKNYGLIYGILQQVDMYYLMN